MPYCQVVWRKYHGRAIELFMKDSERASSLHSCKLLRENYDIWREVLSGARGINFSQNQVWDKATSISKFYLPECIKIENLSSFISTVMKTRLSANLFFKLYFEMCIAI